MSSPATFQGSLCRVPRRSEKPLIYIHGVRPSQSVRVLTGISTFRVSKMTCKTHLQVWEYHLFIWLHSVMRTVQHRQKDSVSVPKVLRNRHKQRFRQRVSSIKPPQKIQFVIHREWSRLLLGQGVSGTLFLPVSELAHRFSFP